MLPPPLALRGKRGVLRTRRRSSSPPRPENTVRRERGEEGEGKGMKEGTDGFVTRPIRLLTAAVEGRSDTAQRGEKEGDDELPACCLLLSLSLSAGVCVCVCCSCRGRGKRS